MIPRTGWIGMALKWSSMALVVGSHLVLLLVSIPVDIRGPLHPDDHEVREFGRAVLDRGFPAIPVEEAAFAGDGSIINPDDEAVSIRPPGIFYLLAPFSSLQVESFYSWAALVSAVSVAGVMAVAYRMHGVPGALLSGGFFGFAANALFWGNFLFSNMLGIAAIAWGVRFAMSERRPGLFVGGLVVGLLGIVRYEFLAIQVALAAAWAVGFGLRQQNRQRLLWQAGGFSLGLAISCIIIYRLYGTLNVLGITRYGTSALSTTADLVSSTGTASGIEQGLAAFGILAFLPLILLAGAALLPERRWYSIGLAGAVLAIFGYFISNSFHPTEFLLARSQARYLLPLTMVGAWSLAALGASAIRSRQWLVAGTMAASLVLYAGGSVLLVSGDDGFASAQAYLEKAEDQRDAAAALPPSTVFVGEYSAKVLFGRDVIVPDHFPAETRRAEVLALVHELLQEGRPIYGSTHGGNQYRAWIEADERMGTSAPSGAEYWEATLS